MSDEDESTDISEENSETEVSDTDLTGTTGDATDEDAIEEDTHPDDNIEEDTHPNDDDTISISSITEDDIAPGKTEEKTYRTPEEIRGLKDRRLRAEDSQWAKSPIPELKDMALESAMQAKGPEMESLLQNTTSEQLERMLEMLPLDIPKKYTLPVLANGRYWERQCSQRWQPNLVWQHKDNWKVMFVERTVQEYLESFIPGESEDEMMTSFLKDFIDYISRLKISKLQRRQKKPPEIDTNSEDFDSILDDILSEPESSTILLDFESVFGCLRRLQKLELVPTPNSFDVEMFHMSPADFKVFINGLKKLEELQIFRCSNSLMTNDQLIFLSGFFYRQPVKELDLSFNLVGDATCEYIAQLLLSKNQLEVLNLRYNKISDEGCIFLSAALFVNSTLKELDLAMNRIGDRGGVFLAKCLLENSTIEVLDVSKNCLGQEAGLGFAKLVEKSKSLRSLNLAENSIRDEAGCALKIAMGFNFAITKLDIRFCRFSEATEDSIYQAVFKNRTLYPI